MTEAPTILVVDDEEVMRDSCRQTLERCQYRVDTASDGVEALKLIQIKRFDLAILDLKMPRLDGTEFLRRVRSIHPDLDVVVITGYSSINSAVECIRLGAYDYLAKPFEADTLRLVVGRALEKRRLLQENKDLRQRLRREIAPDVLVGESPAIQKVRDLIARVAVSETTMLIQGETGTGKELVARAIHRASPRRDRPFVAVDCGALVESLCESELFGHVRGAFTGAVASRPGRFELADKGTIFLDEIGNVGPVIQGKLLRVTQEREITRVGGNEAIPVDVRIIAATNQDLRAAMREGRFREDLYYRLSVVAIDLPPLRERREEIPLLAEALLNRLCDRKLLAPKRLSPAAMRLMQGYDWPGNVRELENTLERALVLARGAEIMPEDLQFADQAAEATACGLGPDDLRLEAVEARHVLAILEKTNWQLSRAAGILGIDRKTLWRKIKGYGLSRS